MNGQSKTENPPNLKDGEDVDLLFSPEFLSVSTDEICKNLADNGYYFFERGVLPDCVDAIVREATSTAIGFNYNDVTPVRNFRQTFFSNCLCGSRSIVKLISSPAVLNIARSSLGLNFRLKCQRYYESGKGYQLGWHTDNKTVDNKKTGVKGIVFIVYLCDTFDGELEVVKGSNNWSGQSLSNDFDDNDLRKNHLEAIISLPGRSGSIIITDTWTVHRTAMLKSSTFKRKSLFFQIDNDLTHSEKILINPEYFPRQMTPEMLQFFGFGLPSGYKTMPSSGLNTLTAKDLIVLILNSAFYLLMRVRIFEAPIRFLLKKPKPKSNVING